MRMKQILNSVEVKRTSFEEARTSFIKHCKLRNLSERTLEYYEEDISYLHSKMPVKYIDEITQEKYEELVLQELERDRKVTSLNTHIRGWRVFFRFCAQREYMDDLEIKLLKADAEIKEPYTDAELRVLLKKPISNRWVEWRSWAIVNYLVATGNRASTVVNIKISDINFDDMTIHLVKVKNRRQQLIPLSPALKEVLENYLKTWEWNADDYLFPTYEGKQMTVSSLQSTIREYNISRKVTKTSLHLFRHTFAKNFILAGGGMVQLQMLLGHSTLEMTRRYINVYGMDLKRDFERLNPLDNFMKGRA